MYSNQFLTEDTAHKTITCNQIMIRGMLQKTNPFNLIYNHESGMKEKFN